MSNLILLPLLLLQDAVPTAPATDAAGGAPPGMLESLLGGSMLVPLALCFGVFWFLILRPESKQRKKRAEMLAAIKKGDRVQTNGGLLGTVVQVQEGIVTLQVDEGVRLKFVQNAIGAIVGDDGVPLTESK
jgi:preprotein translocase subunit YajC